jgi:glycosyltransferase involved in cell wall biosynthesis
MRAADLMVLPSTHDGCPTVVLEAMTLGIPVVATAVGGIVDQIEPDVSGLLVPPADPESLADALQRTMNNQELREQLAQTAKRHVERFYVAALAQCYEALCMQLLTTGQAGTSSTASVPEAGA